MKDRYLFKAKHFNEWHIGNIVKEPDGLYIRDIKKNVMAFINDESTICQCTGLKDKNGNMIWENDICDRKEQYPEIVKYCNGDWTLDYSYVSNKKSGANYCNLGFYTEERKCVEVIGNIFDNPELLGINTQNDLERPWLEKYTEENDRD